MNQILSQVGSLWLGQKANKQLDSVGNDINAMTKSIEGGVTGLLNKMKGKIQKPLPELLKEYDLPIGIFPLDTTNYEFNEKSRRLTVYVPSIREVGYKDSSILRFTKTVTGILEKGKFTDIEGMKTKVVLLWLNVTCIISDSSKLCFTAGIRRTRDRDVYDVQREGVTVEKF